MSLSFKYAVRFAARFRFIVSTTPVKGARELIMYAYTREYAIRVERSASTGVSSTPFFGPAGLGGGTILESARNAK